MSYEVYIRLYKNHWLGNVLAGDMSKLCVKTSNVCRKNITIDEIRFLCVEKLSHKCWPRDVKTR